MSYSEKSMMKSVEIEQHKTSKTFLLRYYLKEELVDFCRRKQLPVSGSKNSLTQRIADFIDQKEVLKTVSPQRPTSRIEHYSEESLIEEKVVCSEVLRAFFVSKIGKSFSFIVAFQKWLKANAGQTYQDAIVAYYTILADKKKNKTTIDSQFKYNTYIRDFFKNNPGKTLPQAILCWKYKKTISGAHQYESSDLKALD